MQIIPPTCGKLGRRGLPQAYKDQIIADYLRLNSTRKVAAIHGRTRQAIWEILRTAKCQMQPVRPPTRHLVEYQGRKFTPGKSGYLRDTLHGGRRDGTEKQLNRQVWVDHNGPIPPGHEVCFLDGNKLNCDIKNLVCLPRPEARRRFAPGHNQHTKRLLEERLEKNMGMVMRHALRLNRLFSTVPVEDLVQQGRLGIVEAHNRYKKDKGANFLSYAVWWIKQKMNRWVQLHAGTIRMPADKLAFAPTMVAFDAPVADEADWTFADVIGVDETTTDAVDTAERFKLLEKALKRLPKQEREVMRLRFWENETLDEIAAKLDISREWVRQLERKALRLLRRKKAIRNIHRIRRAA